MNIFAKGWIFLCKFWFAFLGSYPVTDTYENRIMQLSKYDLDEIVDNFDDSHAAIAIEQIYLKAAALKRPVRIVTGHFNPIVYENHPMVISAFEKCVSKKIDIKVVITEPVKFNQNNTQFAENIKKLNRNKKINIVMTSKKSTPHMIVVGDSGSIFRYETNSKTYNGKVSFNSPEVGRAFVNNFDLLFKEVTGKLAGDR